MLLYTRFKMAAETVEDYIAERSEPVGEILLAARKFILTTLPTAKEVMKWGVPAYVMPDGRALFYLYGGRNHANLGFVEGARLEDPHRLLKGSGKMGRHIKLASPPAVKKAAISRLLKVSAKLPPLEGSCR